MNTFLIKMKVFEIQYFMLNKLKNDLFLIVVFFE